MVRRKLFCEISPLAFRISRKKCILLRRLSDILSNDRFASTRLHDPLPVVVYRHNSLIRRKLGNTEPELQENKAVNLSIAAPKVTGIIIRPGETFSFWRLVGEDSARHGYKEGLTIASGRPSKGVGGGLCQFTNLIHWMILHSEMTIVEHHHHDGLDLFPDFKRQIPFGTGTSIVYNYLDYRFRNDSEITYQIIVGSDGEYLRGELRASVTQPHSFHIHAENEFFSEEDGVIYRNGTVYRDTVDKRTGEIVRSSIIRHNHAKVMYEIAPEKVRRPGKE